MKSYRALLTPLIALALGACANGNFAPLINGNGASPDYAVASGPGGAVTVRKGDTLFKIARRNGVDLRALIDANGISPPYTIYPGQKLRLPGAPPAATAAATTGGQVQGTQVQGGGGQYVVSAGDSVYRIAEVHNIEPGALVKANGLKPPFRLSPGQKLVIPGRNGTSGTVRTVSTAVQNQAAPSAAAPSTQETSRSATPVPARPPVRQTARRSPPPPLKPPPVSRYGFIWPVNGKVILGFGAMGKGLKNDGLNIAAARGTPVRAVENGVVAYAGNELRGFGNLLLIKHSNGWISAYAHNERLLVKTGDRVTRGQVISRVGKTGSVDTPQLHFELRRGNRAVDPERYLGRQSASNVPVTGFSVAGGG